MKIRDSVVSAIRASLTPDNGFFNMSYAILQDHVEAGCSLNEILDGLDGTTSRFHITRSGMRIELRDFNDLNTAFRSLLLRHQHEAERLLDECAKGEAAKNKADQAAIILEAGQLATSVEWSTRRINRFLRPSEHVDPLCNPTIVELLKRLEIDMRIGHHGENNAADFQQGEATDLTEVWTQSNSLARRHSDVISPPGLNARLLLRELAMVAEGVDGKAVQASIARCLANDVFLKDIAAELARSEWRFEFVHSQMSEASVVVANTSQLRKSYEDHVNELGEVIRLRMRSSEAKRALGHMCFALTIEARRLERYLMSSDPFPDASKDISLLFRGTGLEWDGTYGIKRKRGRRNRPVRSFR